MEILWQALLGHLETLPRSVRERPQLSGRLTALMTQAWLFASLESNEPQIRSQHLLMALTEKPELLACDDLWVLLSVGRVQLGRLRATGRAVGRVSGTAKAGWRTAGGRYKCKFFCACGG